jgi:serine phosphatase RsbU (regulator of sigma subunit)
LGLLFKHSKGNQLASSVVLAIAVFACLYTVPNLSAQNITDTTLLSRSQLSNSDQTIYITDSWKFRLGDNLSWASPSLTDSSWQNVSTYLGPSELPFIEWEGIGWFRINFKVDSSLVDFPLALLIEQHNGASEIYLDGVLIYSLGEMDSFKTDFSPYRDNRPRPLVFSDTSTHVLAVRYANPDAQTFNDYGFTAGFRFLIGNLNFHISSKLDEATNTLWTKTFYAGILLAFTIVHFLLFAFYPVEKRNLYFALFTGFLTLLTFTLLQADSTTSPLSAITYYRISLIAWLLTIIYALRFSYSLFYEKVPKAYWFFLGLGISLATATWFNAQNLDLFRELFVVITLVEILRVLISSSLKQKSGVWIIGTGLIFFVAGIMYTVLANLNIFSGDPAFGNLYGSAALILGMSIYLSREFARTNKRLQHKLVEVKHLSERSLQQERINKQKEIERKLLEAENTRKSNELEEARALQLSMLPKRVPDSKYWDISVYMETAQEVGGDYYDFAFNKNGTMTVAVGDATGHGMKAGIMVATAKSYFHTLVNEYENIEMLRRMSSGIQNMNLKMLYMSMLFLKCEKHSVQYTAAGMPPILHFESTTKQVSRHLQKGMPLGTAVNFPYQQKDLHVNPGDCLLIMSDGLMELFNKNRELLGIERIEKVFQKKGELSPNKILNALIDLSKEWRENHPQEDDITIMILKAKNFSHNP